MLMVVLTVIKQRSRSARSNLKSGSMAVNSDLTSPHDFYGSAVSDVQVAGTGGEQHPRWSGVEPQANLPILATRSLA